MGPHLEKTKKKVRTDSGRPYLPKYAEVSYGVLVSKRIRMEHLLVHSHDTTIPYAEVRREHLTPPGKNQKKSKNRQWPTVPTQVCGGVVWRFGIQAHTYGAPTGTLTRHNHTLCRSSQGTSDPTWKKPKKKVRTDSGRPYLPKYAEVSYGVLVSKRIRMEHLLVHSHDTTMPYAEVRREHLTPPGKNQKKSKNRQWPTVPTQVCRGVVWRFGIQAHTYGAPTGTLT